VEWLEERCARAGEAAGLHGVQVPLREKHDLRHFRGCRIERRDHGGRFFQGIRQDNHLRPVPTHGGKRLAFGSALAADVEPFLAGQQ
ncbi:MAG: hypothetical protein ACRDJN_14210, partial [Chloroflexota bacterium]